LRSLSSRRPGGFPLFERSFPRYFFRPKTQFVFFPSVPLMFLFQTVNNRPPLLLFFAPFPVLLFFFMKNLVPLEYPGRSFVVFGLFLVPAWKAAVFFRPKAVIFVFSPVFFGTFFLCGSHCLLSTLSQKWFPPFPLFFCLRVSLARVWLPSCFFDSFSPPPSHPHNVSFS